MNVGRQSTAVRVYRAKRPATEPVLWPSVGEYPVYDEVLYYIMTTDEVRNRRYREAIRRHVPGRVALDVGTGQQALWARECAAAGARRVYAVEEMRETYDAARAVVDQLGLQDRILLVHGSATSVQLPEKADVCVSEIIGTIGSSEGAPAVLRDTGERLLAPGGVMIPHRCRTRVAAVELPELLRERPAFEQRNADYVGSVFDAVGHPFDVRLCIENASPSWLVSTSDIFEEVSFGSEIEVESTRHATLRIHRAGRVDGLMLWIELSCAADQDPIDSLHESVSWIPVVFPLFHPPIDVTPGDALQLSCQVRLSDDGVHPDYEVSGELERSGSAIPFAHSSDHHGTAFRASELHRRLFP